MQILVTGGAGFIGSHLCKKLLENGDTVYCVDNLISGSKHNIEALMQNPRFIFINHDVIQSLNIDVEIDQMYHLASPASPNHHSKISYHALALETMLVNTTGTLELLNLAKKHDAQFLFASTSEIYGDPEVHPQPETYQGSVHTTGPRSVYDEAKRFGETIISYFWREHNVNARIVRIFNTYGPNMLVEDKRMIVNFILQALADKPLTVYGDGSQSRSLCYVSDTVEGLMRLMNYPDTSQEIVNIGAQEEHTVLEYAHMIKKLTNSKSEIVMSEQLPEDDPKQRQPDIAKAKKLLNWEPTVTLEHGLQKTIEYFQDRTKN
ncbi:SDR family oxidoreductase [Candidatus Woesebacteria bacterium]|nr:SDR family oxidoreductase [Candidatus Woesebacteria bacterium]